MDKENTRFVIVLTFVATLGGLLFGYDTAVISGAVGAIDHYFIFPQHLSGIAASSLSGWTISSALLGCILGAAIAGIISNRFGRKRALMVAALMFLLGSIGSAMPELGLGVIGQMGPAALTPFIIYRIIGGMGVGIASMVSPLYIAEIAPSEIRGRLVSFNQLAIVIGILLVYFVNWFIQSLGTHAWYLSTAWRLMLASESVPALLFFVLLFFVPDTPRWFVMRGRTDDALKQLTRANGETKARTILADIQRTLKVHNEPLLTFGIAVILIGTVLSAFQQFVGINAVLYYAPLMFKNMGASTNSAFLQTVVVGAANLVFTFVAIATVDRIGRKPLLLIGSVVMALSMFALGGLFDTHAVGLWALVAVVAYIAGFALSWGPVVWVLLSEMFPNSIKGKAMAIAVAAQWLANLFVSWSFKVMDDSSWLNAHFNHGFAYWVYGAMGVLSALFVLRFVPETKGRTLESIQELWTRPDTGKTLSVSSETV